MPSIVIGGENVNVGLRYLDELARQRQLAMQERESAARLAAINKASQSNYENVTQQEQYDLQFAGQPGYQGGGGGGKGQQLSELSQIHAQNKLDWANQEKMGEDKRRWQLEFDLDKQKQQADENYKKSALEQHWKETEAKGAVDIREAEIRSKDAQARLLEQQTRANALGLAKSEAAKREQDEATTKHLENLANRASFKVARMQKYLDEGGYEDSALREAYEAEQAAEKEIWNRNRSKAPGLPEFKEVSFEDWGNTFLDQAKKNRIKDEDAQVGQALDRVGKMMMDNKGRLEKMSLEDAKELVNKWAELSVFNKDVLQRMAPMIKETLESSLLGTNIDAQARESFKSELLPSADPNADHENSKMIKNEFVNLQAPATDAIYAKFGVPPPKPPKEEGDPVQERMTVEEVMATRMDVNAYKNWLRESWRKIGAKTGSTTSLDDFLSSYYPSAEELKSVREKEKKPWDSKQKEQGNMVINALKNVARAGGVKLPNWSIKE